MDETDHQLISLLRQDSRLPVAALALKLQVSRGTVTNRIRRLEDEGVIVGYTVRLRPDVQHNAITVDNPCRVFCGWPLTYLKV